MSKKKSDKKTIAQNRAARHNYFIEQTLEAGICLEGWEVKSLREGRLQLKESYVSIRGGESFLLGAHISSSSYVSTHSDVKPTRARKLLLHKKEINHLAGQVEKKNLTIVVLNFYFKKNKIKLTLALARGKKNFDKRQTQKIKDWQRDKQRILKSNR